MIYLIGPESRKIKPGQNDKTWEIRFPTNEDPIKKSLFVSRYKSIPFKQEEDDNMMVISVKQASLLALETLNRVLELALTISLYILIPLAGAIFSREDIEEISHVFNSTPSETVKKLNTICQSGGQYFDTSDGSVAVVVAFAATRNLRDENIKRSIVT